MKKLVVFVLTLAVLAGVFFFSNFGGVVKKAIETAGTAALGTPVHVGSVAVSLADKTARLSGLSIKNPAGFPSKYLLQVDGISIKLGDISQKVVTINDIVVDGMTVTYELGPKGANFDVIKRSMASSASSGSTATSSQVPGAVIQKLKIINAKAIPSIGVARAPIQLPDITINNIGNKNSPAVPEQVALQIINKILSVTTASILKAGLRIPANIPGVDIINGVGGGLIKGLLPQ